VNVHFITTKRKTQVYGVDDAKTAESNINKGEDNRIWTENKIYKKMKMV